MQTRMIAVALSAALIAGMLAYRGSLVAQAQCLHGNGEDSMQRSRRVAALRLAQTINTNEASALRNGGQFQELGTLSVDLTTAAGFESQFTTNGRSYSLILRDTLDPCGFAVSTNQVGMIFQGYPIDYDVQPVQRSR